MNYLRDFSKVKVLVVGDLMLDRYWWGTVKRISPEAPVPIVHLNKSSFTVGGAANVAANVAGLGAEVVLIGVIGKDQESVYFREALLKANVSDKFLIAAENHTTTVKTRVIAHSQQVLRIDQEINTELNKFETEHLLQIVKDAITKAEVVIISDYAKGLLSDDVLKILIDEAKSQNKNVLIDPKGKDFKKYSGATILTPNKKELGEACGFDEDRVNVLEDIGRSLMSQINLSALLVTQGENGMTLMQNNKKSIYMKASAREIYDVTGAGDTVIATLGVSIGAGRSLETSAQIANTAAGIVVEQVGTSIITREKLEPKIEY